MLNSSFYILIAILILGVIVFCHELGHYLVGRLSGIGIIEFSIGFGPKLFGWKGKHNDFSLRLLPLGGYCKFVGEDEDDPDPHAFNNAPVWKRFLTVFAGPAMNFMLAYLAAIVTLCIFGTATIAPLIGSLSEDMPAQTAGLQIGDLVTQANGQTISNDYEGVLALRSVIQSSDTVELTVLRSGEKFDFTITPSLAEQVDENGVTQTMRQIGVVFSYTYQTYNPLQVVPGAAKYMLDTAKSMLDTIRGLIFKGEGMNEVSGAVGTVAVVAEVVQSDAKLIWNILFLISLNLGIMNLLPLPALDGGRLIFLFVEGIRRKPIPRDKEGMVHALGLLFFLILTVVLLFHDIWTFIL